MNALFRHLAVRSWMTVFSGGALCLLVLPAWQRIFGLHWLALPAVAAMLACFLLIGAVMHRLGAAMARRQVKEAAIWERAGMTIEAEEAFERAKALFDSFWFSPLTRRTHAQKISGALARFYLNQASGTTDTRSLVAGYLKRYPGDISVAETWLESLIAFETYLDQEHEAAARVGEALGRNENIQRLLMQFFVASHRVDFEALQTYRRVWRSQRKLMAPDQVLALARLLLAESIVTPWALQVFIQASQQGEPSALKGVAACVRMLPLNEETRKDIALARTLITEQDAMRVSRTVDDFSPMEDHAISIPTENRAIYSPVRDRALDDEIDKIEEIERERAEPFSERFSKLAASAARMAIQGAGAVGRQSVRWARRMREWGGAIPPRQLIYALGGIGCAGALAVLLLTAHRQPAAPVQPQPKVNTGAAAKPANADPFTIQVAAFLKPEDAQRFVDMLAKHKLDAFYTKAASANRTWYQVKVSHFPTREAAQNLGQALKSKGLIDDFYVANYKRP